jgi:hypothetical protein
MLVSLYAFGKWAVAALAALGWCYWAIPAMFTAAANPALTPAARRQLLVLAGISAIPVLAIIWLVASSGDDALIASGQIVEDQVPPAVDSRTLAAQNKDETPR